MTCTGDWATHHNACGCREAERAEEVERLLTSNGSLRLRVAAAEREREEALSERDDARRLVAALRARLAACERVVDAAREFRRWDAILALTIGEGQDAEDAQDDLRAIDAALAALDGREAP